MLIDWFTVGAQTLNFVILVWLLKRFLYQPVLDAIDAREALIARQIADSQAMQRDAQAKRDAFEQKALSFDRERADLLAQATRAADAEHTRLIGAARQAADELGARRREALKTDALQLNRDLGERARREVFAIARKVLTDLAVTGLEERIAEVFIARLGALDAAARTVLATALQSSAQPALVRSSFELPAVQQAAIRAAVAGAFGATVALRFDTAAGLVGGIELVAGGQKLSWTIAHYLDSLEHLVSDVVAPQPEDSRDAPAIESPQSDVSAA